MTAELSTAKKTILILVLSIVLLGSLIYEMTHPMLFPLLKQAVIKVLTNIPIFTRDTSLAFLNSPTFSL